MKTLIKNRKAFYNYSILEKYTAGIMLMGTEVKSIKHIDASISEAYCLSVDNELFIKGMYIGEYKEGGKHNAHGVNRDRKLLLTRKEINKIQTNLGQNGLTLIPLELFISDNGYIKLEIGLAKGKKIYDKKETIKIRDLNRDLQRNS